MDYINIDLNSENGESSKHVNRLIPTLEPVEGATYVITHDIDVVMDHNNYTTSYKYLEYPEINDYVYYKVEPCKHYKLVPYVKYSYKPANEQLADPSRVQLVGKYSSQLCDIFDVDVVWNVTMDGTPGYEMSFGLEGTGVLQHNTEIHNPTWNNVNFINSWKKLPKLTRICFTYDKCKILGKRNPTWTFKNITTGTEKVIKSKYGMYLFTEAGDYSITLELYDSNKNKYIATKNYLTII